MKLYVFLEVSAQAWHIQFVACLEIKAKMKSKSKRIIQSCRTSTMYAPLPSPLCLISHLLLSSLPFIDSPLSPSPPSMPFSPLLLELPSYFTRYQNDKFAVDYTHAGVPGSSDTSGDSGGRRPRRRSEIQCNFTITKKAYQITIMIFSF